jgi:hypothetical protein
MIAPCFIHKALRPQTYIKQSIQKAKSDIIQKALKLKYQAQKSPSSKMGLIEE